VRILGIDPGSRVAGFGVVESAGGGACRAVVSGVIKLGDGPLAGRLLTLHTALQSILAEHQPAAVAIEGVFSRVSPRSALVLGHARGVAVLCAAQAELPVFEYAPATIKRSLTQGGAASKQTVARAVGMVLGIRVALAADAADALAVAICHHARARLQVGPRAGTPSAWVRALAGAPRTRQTPANLLLAASLKGR
jgi:crossover junction endodeoxyribonuclease RuvC